VYALPPPQPVTLNVARSTIIAKTPLHARRLVCKRAFRFDPASSATSNSAKAQITGNGWNGVNRGPFVNGTTEWLPEVFTVTVKEAAAPFVTDTDPGP